MCIWFSSLLHSPGRLRIVFNVIEQVAGSGRHCDRRGVCTGWLSDLSLPMLSQSDSVKDTQDNIVLSDKPVVVCYTCVIRIFFLSCTTRSVWFCAISIASFGERLLDFSSCWIVFSHVIQGRLSGLLQSSISQNRQLQLRTEDASVSPVLSAWSSSEALWDNMLYKLKLRWKLSRSSWHLLWLALYNCAVVR